MTRRLASLLSLLARLLLAGAFVAPLVFGMLPIVAARPEVQWMATNFFWPTPITGVPAQERFVDGGFSVVLANTSRVESEHVQITLSRQPDHVDVLGPTGSDHELIPTDEGMIIELGAIPPGDDIVVTFYDLTQYDLVHVLHGGEPVEEAEPLPRFDSRVRLPRWALLAGLFLLAGLIVQVLALRSRPTGVHTR